MQGCVVVGSEDNGGKRETGAVAVENWHKKWIVGDLVRGPNGICACDVRAVYVEKKRWKRGREGMGRNGVEVKSMDGGMERKWRYIGKNGVGGRGG